MTIYCPTCNRSSEECAFVGEFCEFCAAEKIKRNIDLSGIAKVYQCRFCNRIKVANEFVSMKEDEDALGMAIRLSLRIKDCKVMVNDFRRGIAKCTLVCNYNNESFRFDTDIKVKLLHETCQRCYRISSGYFQGLIQLRGDRVRIERMLKRIERYMESSGAYITKTEDAPNGVDVYVSDKKAANEFFIEKKIKATRSYTLYGIKRGKQVYRNTYAVHL